MPTAVTTAVDKWPAAARLLTVAATGHLPTALIPGSVQGNRDLAGLVALRRLGTVDDCAKVVEFLATDLSDCVTGAVIPIGDGLYEGNNLLRNSGSTESKNDPQSS